MSTSVASLSTNFFPSAENGFTTTTSGSVSSGATTVGLNSVAGYSNGEVAVFVIDPTDAVKKQTFTGVVDTSGSQITNVVWTAGSNTTHALGATVVDYATATHISMMSKGILVDHNQDGTHKFTTVYDANGNESMKLGSTASAVNEVTITNAATGNGPTISATGGDTNIDVNVSPKGTTGKFKVGGNTITHGAYTSYTPTLTNLTLGTGTMVADYHETGKKVTSEGRITIGNNAPSGTLSISLPFTTSSKYGREPIGVGSVYDASTTTYYPLYAMWQSTTTFRLVVVTTTTGANPVFNEIGTTREINGTTPVAFATGDIIAWKVDFEKA